MKLPGLLALPPAVLALLVSTASAAELQWPHNLPKHLKYFPEEERHVKRGLEVQEKLRRNEKPVGLKKMSGVDEGEMFMLGDWIFASDIKERAEEESRNMSLGKRDAGFDPPLRPVFEDGVLDYDAMARFRVRDVLLKRDYKCPSGTKDCSSIGAPNSCCGTSQTCISIQDTGYGSVGCCGQGETCSGTISCDTAKGYSSCPNSSNGGCCLPGYTCQDVGCVVSGTSVTYVQPSTTSTSSSMTSVIVVPTTTAPQTSSSYICSTGWFSCAASLGGGCCQNGRTCATGASCLGSDSATSSATTSASTTASPSAPVRPTSVSGTTTASSLTTDLGQPSCPVGFYACQAYYPSGCCRVGRDCQTTGSCILATPSTTLVNTNGVTIVGPSGASVATGGTGNQAGQCPSAWYSCAASQGGNCCPEGYACGEQCSATNGTGVSNKVAPSSKATIVGLGEIWALVGCAVAVGMAMIVL